MNIKSDELTSARGDHYLTTAHISQSDVKAGEQPCTHKDESVKDILIDVFANLAGTM